MDFVFFTNPFKGYVPTHHDTRRFKTVKGGPFKSLNFKIHEK